MVVTTKPRATINVNAMGKKSIGELDGAIKCSVLVLKVQF
jgi:hypothetical protein